MLWALLAVATLVLLSKFFVWDVYRVGSGSMRPTLFGGSDRAEGEPFTEHVLVLYGNGAGPERFDLVVIRPRGGGDPIVKRVGALPNESVQIVDGDVLIEGRRLGPDVRRPEPIPLFDSRIHRVDEMFSPVLQSTTWKPDGEEWRLDASAVPIGNDGGMISYHKDIGDGYLDQNDARVAGTLQVNDGVIECEVLLEESRGRLRLQLSEEGDTFRAFIEPAEAATDGFRLVLTRHNHITQARTEPGEKTEVMLDESIPFVTGAWHRLRFSNIDNHLIFELDDGSYRKVASYDENVPHRRSEVARKHIAYRASLGGESCLARFRSIRVLRDLYYTPRYTEDQKPSQYMRTSLGPDKYYVLGDNSAHSTDSRTTGPVSTSEIIGTPVAVVWPPSRFRWL